MIRVTLIQAARLAPPSTSRTSSHFIPIPPSTPIELVRDPWRSVSCCRRCQQQKYPNRSQQQRCIQRPPTLFLIRLPFWVFEPFARARCHHHHHIARIGRHLRGPNCSEGPPHLHPDTSLSPSESNYVFGGFFCLSAFKILKNTSDRRYVLSRLPMTFPVGKTTTPRNLSKMPHRWFSCMTEPHFSERSASLESHLRPKIVAICSTCPKHPPCDYGRRAE
jgi:hypothetical protein